MTKYPVKMVLITIILSLVPVLGVAELNDPTKPPDVAASSLGTLVLSAVIISPENKLAVINGKIFHEGDTVNGMKVISIEANSVDLASPQEKLTLTLLTKSVKSGNY
jgi:hypothetical protein